MFVSRPSGDLVLDGSSTLTLTVASLQQLTRLFEQYLLSRSQQHGFLALPSHPAETASLLQLQFLFDILQKTLSLKVISKSKKTLKKCKNFYSDSDDVLTHVICVCLYMYVYFIYLWENKLLVFFIHSSSTSQV